MASSVDLADPWTRRLYAVASNAGKPPEKLTVWQWADRFRVLGPETAEPWSNDRTPYMREICEGFTDRRVAQITMQTSTQVGKTDALILNCIGYVIDQDPGPAMFVLPRDEDRDKMATVRIRSLVDNSPAVRKHKTQNAWDVKKEMMTFDRMTLYITASGSPAGLASTAIRYLWLDELDKMPAFSGKESDPESLARERQRTFWNRKLVKTSTPTTKTGAIHLSFLSSDQRRYHVPCIHCEAYQVLTWSGVRFPEEVTNSEEMLAKRLATYHCAKCGAELRDVDKPRMLRRGVWVPNGAEIVVGGDGLATVVGARPSSHRGYQLSALYSPWLTWSEVAAEYLKGMADETKGLFHFTTSWLGEPFEDETENLAQDVVSSRVTSYAADTIPDGCVVLTAGVDVGKTEIHYVVRGWGKLEESWLIRAGRVNVATTFEGLRDSAHDGQPEGFQELEELLFHGTFGGKMVHRVCIDSGYNTDEVYRLCRKWRDRAYAVKGQATLKSGLAFSSAKLERHGKTGSAFVGSIVLTQVNTAFFKDKLNRAISMADGASSGRWHVHEDPSPEYLKQVSSEHKIMVRKKRANGMVVNEEVWVRKPGHGANHWLDAEVYAMVAAFMIGVQYYGRKSVGQQQAHAGDGGVLGRAQAATEAIAVSPGDGVKASLVRTAAARRGGRRRGGWMGGL